MRTHALRTTEMADRINPQELPEAGAGIERALIEAALAGDGKAFGALVQPHLPLLYRVASRVCRDAQLAEEAVQETLAVAYRQLGKYEPGTSIKAHLAGIAVKRAHTLLRSEIRRGNREQASPPPSACAGAEELMSAAQQASRVRAVLAGMPEKRREAALLRLDAGLSFAEIARTLDTTEGSARVLVHLALKELREHLSELLESRGG